MKSVLLFAGGIVTGMLMTQAVAAQDSAPRALSHVGIAVRDFDRALAYYTKTIGLREAYSLKQPDGRPLLTYLHVNRDTFVELVPASASQPPGLYHFAIEFGDLNAAVARMRQQGAAMADTGLTPGRALFTRTTDPDGVQLELMQFGPDSQQRKAMEAWK